jgi:glycine/D-amino acid oxidase-like deaminating enzyme
MQHSVWEKETFFAPQDIIIAGSGVTGLWCAIHLKEKNPTLRITIIDRGLIPTGASTRNAGFSCFGSLSELISDAALVGEEAMLQLVTMRYRGLQKIRSYFPAATIGYEEHGGYEMFNNAATYYDECRDKMTYYNQLLQPITGLAETYIAADDAISGYGLQQVTHLIKNKQEGQLHSGLLVQALLQKAYALGVQVFPAIEIISFEETNGSVILHTSQGLELHCNRLLICTNGFAKQLLPQLDVQPARGQVLVTTPINNLPLKGTFHYDHGYYYFRNLGNRVLLGGGRNIDFESETTTSMETTQRIQNALEKLLRETILPHHNYGIEIRWSGIMGMGQEKLPIVKPVSNRVYCAVRMSGMGVALAPVMGELVTEMMA